MGFRKVTKVDNGKVEIEFSIDKAKFDAELGKVFKKRAARMAVPGFRKGKAPRSIIEKMYGKGVFYEDAINNLLPEAYEDAAKESGAELVSRPEFEIVSVGDGDVELKATAFVKPEVEVKDYKGIKADKIVTPVTDEMVDAEIQRVRERNARLVDVTDRAAEMGDTVKIDFDGYVDDKQFDGGKGEDYSLKLGSGTFIPGFEEQVVGHSIGDEFDVNVTFPEDYGHAELAGKPAVFKCKLHAIQFTELPELDDDFAVDVSDFNTLDEYKADVRKKLEERYENSADNALEGKLIDGMLENFNAEVPECMIDDEVENIVRERDYQLRSQGLDLATYLKYMNASLDDMRAQLRPMGERQVKTRLALEKIALLEKLEATADDIEAEYKKLADQYSMEIEKVKEALSADNLTTDIVLRKAIDFVKAHAAITEKTADEAEAEEKKPAKKAPAKKSTKTAAKTAVKKEKADGEAEAEEAPKPKRTRKTKAGKEAEAAAEAKEENK